MSALNDLLNQAVQKCDPSNDAALAARLGVSRSAISLWRKGEGIREKHLTQLIALVGADPEVAVMVLREQATTHAERAVWGALARRLGAAAAVATVALMTSHPAVAAPPSSEALTASGYMHYAKCAIGAAVAAWALQHALSRSTGGHRDAPPAVLA